MSMKMFDGSELPHELLLTARQKKKARNAFENNIFVYLYIYLLIYLLVNCVWLIEYRMRANWPQDSSSSLFELTSNENVSLKKA